MAMSYRIHYWVFICDDFGEVFELFNSRVDDLSRCFTVDSLVRTGDPGVREIFFW